MKKFFTFAIALVASALALSSCQPTIDSPLVGSWNARGLLYVEDEGEDYETLRMFHFFDNGDFQYNEYLYTSDGIASNDGYILTGSWSVDGDILTLHKKKYGTCHAGQNTFDSSFKPSDETNKWFIDGHYLHLIRLYGTEDAFEETFYDGSGQF